MPHASSPLDGSSRREARSVLRSAARWTATAAGIAAAGYGVYAAKTWLRYGHAPPPKPDEADPLLDRFLPAYDVVERHRIRVAAPARVTLAAASDLELFDLPVARALFKGRELLLRAAPSTSLERRSLLAEALALGWTVLAELPGREIVVGAVTRPWEANVTFRPVPAEEYLAFREPDYVKIVWTLRADPTSATSSIFRTETRALATDDAARAKFRRYWAFLSPGILLIRRTMLRPVRAEAERRARSVPAAVTSRPSPPPAPPR